MKMETLRQRADLLDKTRAFFKQRGFLEVETPLAAAEAIPEQHIQLSTIDDGRRVLQASPEMHHKRLLCAGAGSLFEVTKSFRGYEVGRLHNPEFTILEWYQVDKGLDDAIALTEALFQTLLKAPPFRRTTYREAFGPLGIDPHTAMVEELRELALSRSPSAVEPFESDDRDEWLNVLLALCVEPTLGVEAPEVLYDYPATQASLAKTVVDGEGAEVAQRFEVYWRGMELANGYEELTDAVALRRRLEIANTQRVAAGWPVVPMPERLLSEMVDPGLPPCAGVAIGFDRIVMLATGAQSIGEVRAFAESRRV
ncbi:Elongation factor P--(R)-beta-lysine ligase [Planctomycetes bacterium K2D]|uniref:Elongation factor P--(R)-beta-lysine ligase n=2 Tax=Botrimarina mediterranea TaxID=2528022 RepID=A0A518KEB5_9BACT|nr:Elongation factor P--(R)-beta-lysine ligase [Botrimarina mediterranea]QDV80707.1 Elongation factor P--(R)-beta-lysine ligase [Planctomycetes bacterium K2D]